MRWTNILAASLFGIFFLGMLFVVWTLNSQVNALESKLITQAGLLDSKLLEMDQKLGQRFDESDEKLRSRMDVLTKELQKIDFLAKLAEVNMRQHEAEINTKELKEAVKKLNTGIAGLDSRFEKLRPAPTVIDVDRKFAAVIFRNQIRMYRLGREAKDIAIRTAQVEGTTVVALILNGDFIYAADDRGIVYAFDSASGKVIWKNTEVRIDDAEVTSLFAIEKYSVFVAASNGKLFEFDRSGKVLQTRYIIK